jgi:hypothetical protein
MARMERAPCQPRLTHCIFRHFSLDNPSLHANLCGMRSRKVWRDGGGAKTEKPRHVERGEGLGNPDFRFLLFQFPFFRQMAAESRTPSGIIRYYINLVCFMIPSPYACLFPLLWPFLRKISLSDYP